MFILKNFNYNKYFKEIVYVFLLLIISFIPWIEFMNSNFNEFEFIFNDNFFILINLYFAFIVTSDKDGDGCEADKHIVDSDIVISQPFFPYYLTKEKIAKAKNLKMAITAGIGSDHVDLPPLKSCLVNIPASSNNLTVL